MWIKVIHTFHSSLYVCHDKIISNMSLKNLLDLRKKVDPQIQIVEKIIFQKRSWKTEVLRTVAVIITASAVIWGISNADTLLTPAPKAESKNFSAIGIVSNIATSTLSLQDAKGSDNANQTTYTFDTSTVTKIETKSYIPLTLSDITVGDKVVVQGVDDEGSIYIKRIISFSTTTPPTVATTTDQVATSTDATSTDATSTAPTSPSLIDTIKDAVTNAINAITGTTSTSTEDTSTTTASTTDEATTSVQVATTTDDTSSSTPSNPSIIQTITNAVTDTVNDVVSAITGTTSSTDTPPTPDPLPAPVENPTN